MTDANALGHINIKFIFNESTMSYLNALQCGKALTADEIKWYEDEIKADLVAANSRLFERPTHIVYCFYHGSYPTVPVASKAFVKGRMTFPEFVEHMKTAIEYQDQENDDDDDDEDDKFTFNRFMVAPCTRNVPLAPTVDCNAAFAVGCVVLESVQELEKWFIESS